jgi:hypothetical protein
MSPQHLPHSTSLRGHSRFAILRSLAIRIPLSLSLGAALSEMFSEAMAADPAQSSLPARSKVVSDTVLARSVLAAMDADPELHNVNIVVSVVDGVVVIGGPVTSTAVAKRAELVARQVPGIKEVRNTCFVAHGPDPLLMALAEKMGSPLPSRPPMAELPGVLTGPSPRVWASPPTDSPGLVAAAAPGNRVVVRKPPSPELEGLGLLGAPAKPAGASLPDPAPNGRDNMTVPATLTATVPGVPAQYNARDILTSAGNVKKVEARFANLTVEMRDGTIVIGGSSPQPSDAWDLADKIRRIPGVTRVVVGIAPAK